MLRRERPMTILRESTRLATTPARQRPSATSPANGRSPTTHGRCRIPRGMAFAAASPTTAADSESATRTQPHARAVPATAAPVQFFAGEPTPQIFTFPWPAVLEVVVTEHSVTIDRR